MHYQELIAEGEKRQINQKNEKHYSGCPDKKALREYHETKGEVEDLTKAERIAKAIKAFVERSKREKEEKAAKKADSCSTKATEG